jgi:hypothetical protein
MNTLESTSTTKQWTQPAIDETTARRAANGYLSREVGIAFGAIEGVFVPLEHPIWQFAIQFHLPRLGQLGVMGIVDVNAQTGDPIPLPRQIIDSIQDRADAIVQFRTQPATA